MRIAKIGVIALFLFMALGGIGGVILCLLYTSDAADEY